MTTDYLLLETGDQIILESETGFLLLETSTSNETVFETGDALCVKRWSGQTWQEKYKRRDRRDR
jgi:hypothetical protein